MAALGRELVRSLAGTDLVPRLVAEHPRQAWRVGVVTVLVGSARADLRYARQPVGWCKPSAKEIVAAVNRAVDRLATRSRSPDAFLPTLAAAYARLARPGERVPLVDLRAELGTTRAQFAWDFARLARERRLVVGDRRIDLGIATGHATARRSRVVYLEGPTGTGTFYETFRLIPYREAEARPRGRARPSNNGGTHEAKAATAPRGARSRASAPHPRSNGRAR